jgi:hypothetical protein
MSNAVLGKDFNLGALGSFYYVWTCMFILDLEDFDIFLPKTNVYKNKTSLPFQEYDHGSNSIYPASPQYMTNITFFGSFWLLQTP